MKRSKRRPGTDKTTIGNRPGSGNPWSDDALEYGYVLRRGSGHWWHIHFGRTNVTYYSTVLDRHTNVFAVVQQFAPWAVALSGQFVLNLNGEGVERTAAQLELTCDWGRESNNEGLKRAAAHFQAKAVAVLFESHHFQRALSDIVFRGRHGRME